ncbi:pH-response regulator protein palC [Dacryopinax primogenitus]|uniref:pH-response regulator protein palC n=1 Tax=Dacryopinax primogenitus (strain DJM 731) TaxID=1858805 RepID=M5GCZ1_DACPD|nr:pH-response regulator protein palC [Dacryopinax primogenitus]EJU04137.1 pH-response regulator protein palC [Dacryopinax primogenitus]
MSVYYYELPTTGAVTFGDLLDDRTGTHTEDVSNTSSSRAQVRGILKETKRMGAEKDYLRVIKVVEDYLPHLGGIMDCVFAEELMPYSEPKFSWRSTLSSHLLKNSPRVEGTGFYYELCFCLLTYAYGLCDLAHATVASLGNYEQEGYLSEAERKEKDEQLNFAARTLCKAAGIFKSIPDAILPQWAKVNSASSKGKDRPPDLSPEVLATLPKVAMADANGLAIRKLMSRSVAESIAVPGAPLPKSHPAPSLLGKLWIHVHTEYATARSLVNKSTALGVRDEVDADLRKYLEHGAAHALAMAFKWFGIDAGERGRNGVAMAFLTAAKEDLAELKDVKGTSALESKSQQKEAIAEEIDSVTQWFGRYKVANDSITFQDVPSKAQVRAMIPDGVAVLKLQLFSLPKAAFGPTSRMGESTVEEQADYVRAGQYF